MDYLNPASFSFPASGAFGNVGKGSLRSPGLAQWDDGIFKSFVLHERAHLEFRAEFFNILNRVNFTGPQANDDVRVSVSSGGFGSIRTSADPRIGQLALKLLF